MSCMCNQQQCTNQPAFYCIQVRGRLDAQWSFWFDNMTITVESDHDDTAITSLTGYVADQAALHGLLARIRDLGLPLIQVTQTQETGSAAN